MSLSPNGPVSDPVASYEEGPLAAAVKFALTFGNYEQRAIARAFDAQARGSPAPDDPFIGDNGQPITSPFGPKQLSPRELSMSFEQMFLDLLAAKQPLLTKGEFPLFSSAAPVELTGVTTETVLRTVEIPALGPNDGFIFELSGSVVGANTNNKTFRARLGSISGPQILSNTINTATVLSLADRRSVINRASTASQYISQKNGSLGYATSTGSNNSTTVETSAGTSLVITGLLNNAADKIILDMLRVTLLRG